LNIQYSIRKTAASVAQPLAATAALFRLPRISNDQGWKSLRSTVLFCSVSGYSILFYFKSSTFGQINNPTPHKELQSRLQPTWMLIIPELFYAAVAAGFAPGKPLFSLLDIGYSFFNTACFAVKGCYIIGFDR
jgi:peptidoglycan/LPS O-acetylase OafA/YrhL